jgi:hypothetical protein
MLIFHSVFRNFKSDAKKFDFKLKTPLIAVLAVANSDFLASGLPQ